MRKLIEGFMICGSVIMGAAVILVGGVKWFAEKVEKNSNKKYDKTGN